MTKNQKEKNIFTKLHPAIKNGTINDFNISSILKKNSISEEDFYYFFPNKTKSLCIFFFSNLQLRLEKKIKKKIKNEKSVSKRVNFILFELFNLLNEEKAISLYFLNYISKNPLYLKKTTIQFSNRVLLLI